MMYAISRWLRRFRLFVSRRSFERDLDDELRFHTDMATARNLASGMTTGEARAHTRREFGSMDRFKDEVRDARGITLGDDLARDVRFSLRSLRRTPGFTALALLTFALGIGANTAIFSVVNAALLRPLPFASPSRLAVAYERIKDQADFGGVAVPNWRDWRKQSKSFESLGGYSTGGAVLSGDAEPERVRAAYLSAEVLPMLGVRPMVGRWFTRDEDVPGKDRVAILSEGLWRRRFAADSSMLGRSITIEGDPYVVVGVMPSSFNFPLEPRQTDLWIPFAPTGVANDARGFHWMNVIGRLAPNVSLQQANAEFAQIAERLESQYREQKNRTAAVISLRESLVGDVKTTLYVLLGAVFLVLLIACANIANLLLARHAARRKEAAVRVALGASRGQLSRQLLTESVLLALGGAALGLVLALLAMRALATLGSDSLPIGGVRLDGRVLLALLGIAVLCGLGFGLAPVMQWSERRVRDQLSGLTVKTTSGADMRRMRNVLVIAQIALSLMLLVGAGLLARAFVALHRTETGLVTDRVLTARMAIPQQYVKDHGEATRLLRPFMERVHAIPGVRDVGVTSLLPIEETGVQMSFWVDGRPWPRQGTEPLAEVRGVSPGYFPAMGIPLKTGKLFGEHHDSTAAFEVVVNETLARTFFPGENAVGRRLLQGMETRYDEYHIIGVVGDVRQSGLAERPRPELYAPYDDPRAYFAEGDASLVVKTTVSELSIVPQVRQALRDVGRDVALTNVRSMDDVIERSLTSRKFTLLLFATFAIVALSLAATGLYGVIYYLVTQRTREIGIRMALGADKSRVVSLVLRQGAVLVGIGIAGGLAGAVLLSRLLATLLFGVGAHDPITFIVVPLLLAVVAMLATLVPAWRASRVDPVIALRSE